MHLGVLNACVHATNIQTRIQRDRQTGRQKVVVGVRSFSSLSHLLRRRRRRRRRDTHREHGNASRRGSVTLGSGARDTKLLLRQRGEKESGGTEGGWTGLEQPCRITNHENELEEPQEVRLRY